MAPAGKRKRGDRTHSYDSDGGSNRASPHRPQDLEHGRNQQGNNRGGRRSSRGGRGGQNAPRSPRETPSKTSPLTNKAMSPPALPPVTAPKANAPVAASVQTTVLVERRPTTPVATKPYAYEYLSEERLSSWKDDGRKAVVDAAVQAQSEENFEALGRLFQELARASMDGKLVATDAGAVVQEILAVSSDAATIDSASLFLDAVSILTDADASNPNLQHLLASTGIDPARMRAEMEVPLLIADNLVRPTFAKMAIRKGTSALYKQSAYNLLREETEGYAKLMTELFTTVISAPPSDVIVAETFQRVKALIGAFDLDVGRVLDITLDVFANLLVKHNEFFIKLLRKSSWWPEQTFVEGVEWEDQGFSSLPSWALPGCPTWHYTDEEKTRLSSLKEVRDRKFWERVRDPAVGLLAYFELGARRITSDVSTLSNGAADAIDIDDAATDTKKKREIPDSEKIQKWTQEWIATTHTLPPAGNRIAAQLLGFKLRFYASDARDATDILPDNLIYLAALLIKIGFISLADLYPHLYPLDEDMPAMKERLMKEKAEKEKKTSGSGAGNALLNTPMLKDDTKTPAQRERERLAALKAETNNEKPPEKVEEEPNEKLPEPVDQKTHLLRSLLCIGAIPEALFILGKFPWLLDLYPELPPYIFRLLNHSLSKVYEEARPLSEEEGLKMAKKLLTVESSKIPTNYPPRKSMRWPKLDQKDAGDGVDFRFYWEEWADNVPVCQTVDDVFALCNTLINVVGFRFGQDPMLLTKLARIGRKNLIEDSSEKNTKRWIDLSTRLLAPALSFTGRNPGVVNEVFDLLKTFPTQVRYTIYSEWFTGPTSRSPQISANFAAVKLETKHVLKRISKTNVKPMARLLAKAAYASPGIVFQVALSQIESYENLTDVVIECGRYFTYLAYDVLTWSLMNSLGGVDRNRVQADGMLTSAWLRSLATFAGKVFRRYAVMSPTPILQYVGHQLLKGSSHDLEVLEQIIVSMGGISSDVTLNDSQIQAMSGGEILRQHTRQFHLGDHRHEVVNPSMRLLRSLKDTGLVAQLLIAIALERQHYLFGPASKDAPLKVLGANMDRIHQIFAQYLDFVRNGFDIKEFDGIIPDVISLISDFGVDPSIAFTISRSSIAHAVDEAAAVAKAEKAEKAKKAQEAKDAAQATPTTNDDVEMGEASETPVTNGEHTTTEETTMDVDETAPPTTDVPSPTKVFEATPTPAPEATWNPVLKDLMIRLQPALSEDFEDRFSLSFYVTFWQLSLHDLTCPTSEYEAAIKTLRERMPMHDRRDVSAAGAKKRDEDKKKAMDEQDKIRFEMKAHIQSYSETRKRLKEEKEQWFDGFPMMNAKSDNLHMSMFQDCFLPRLLLSAEDAHFAFVMLKYLHSSGVPGFRTMKFLDQIFRTKQLTALIFQCTAREAENLGRFLNEVIRELKTWHASEEAYKLIGLGGSKADLPGFGRSFKPDRSPAAFIDFEDFRHVLFKWHRQLWLALENCLKSKEYMHIRNAINILKAVNQNFPAVDFMGKSLNTLIKNLADKEKRGDLKLSANSLLGDFKRGERRWVIPQAFHINKSGGLNPPANASRSNSEKPGTPQPSANNAASLDATAQPFAPSRPVVNHPKRPTGKEVEDGEVEDEKRQALANASSAAAQSKEHDTPNSNGPSIPEKPTNLPGLDQARGAPQTSEPRSSETVPHSGSIPPRPERPDSRGGPNRPTHALPVRPDTQTPIRGVGRGIDRPIDRPLDYHNHGRHDVRSGPNTEFGRLDRPGEPFQEPFRGRRDGSPGRGHPRGRTRSPERERGGPVERDRRDPAWAQRDTREYSDDRGMRPPPRDIRLPGGRGPGWGDNPRDSRDPRDVRDPRDRMPMPMDSRGPAAPLDNRSRMHSGPPMPPTGTSPYHGNNRDVPTNPDRSGYMPVKPPLDRPRDASFGRPPPGDRGSIAERASFIDDRSRPETFNSDRDRRDRGSRPHSPRRDERGPPTYPSRGADAPRDHRDDRGAPPERLPPSAFPPQNRDRREDAGADAPTGPRGPRNDFSQPPTRGGPEIFQPTQRAPRPVGESDHGRLNKDFPLPPRPNQQDANYGRLNAPADIPSGPRGRTVPSRGGRNFTAPAAHGFPRAGDSTQVPSSPAADRPQPSPLSDRRDRRESAAMDTMHQSGPPTPSTDQPQDMSGIHPSRQNAFQASQSNKAPQLNTDTPPPSQMAGAPSGPRGSQRTPIPATGPSPVSRNPPTGPASNNERGAGIENKGFAAQFRKHLQPSGPPPPTEANNSFDRNDRNDRGNDRGASIRGRASRPGGPMAPTNNNSAQNTSSPGVSRPSTPNAYGPSRLERTEFPAPIRSEVAPQDEERADSRGHRESRRSERTRHHSRSGSAKNMDRRGEEKFDEVKERPERSSGREKRGGSDRESGRRDRGERGERSEREGGERRDGRERRERGSLREEGGLRRGGPPMVEGEMPSWNDGRTRGAGERGGRERRDGGREEREARKRRGEDVVHGDAKRPRRSGA